MDYKVGYKKPPAKPWAPGQSGNPAGRSKEPLTELLRNYVEANNGEHKHRIISELVKIATHPPAKTQIPAITMIYERLDGKVAEKHEIKALVVNVSNEYAIELLKACRTELEEARQLFLPSGEDAIK